MESEKVGGRMSMWQWTDSPNTDRCKLQQMTTLRKNQKMYAEKKKNNDKNKPKEDGILNSHNFPPATHFSSLSFGSENDKEAH